RRQRYVRIKYCVYVRAEGGIMAEKTEASKPGKIPNAVKFVLGGSAGMAATCVVQPLDLVKNRMQLSGLTGTKEYRSSFHALRSVIANEGLLAVYNGLSAGLLRQATYTTTRLGIYTWLFEKFSTGDRSPSFAMKAALGVTAGAAGSFVGTPAELALIRMCADGRLPADQQRNYKNVFDALIRVVREEGVLTLWRGCGPTVLRAMVVNAAQLATYSQAKEAILKSSYIQDGIFCHFCASMISGLATTIASMPVDIAKTRIQNMRTINGKPEYKGAFDVWSKIVRNEGILALWKGFTPYYFRIGPHTVLTFIFLEQMNAFYFRRVLGIERGRGAL
uniref:Mitochondrial 2-oxoglutarate/malate carrier protein n=2 Tax=Parascaris univalens TaxID=6257 RepID=A0A914ZLP0_PARUN